MPAAPPVMALVFWVTSIHHFVLLESPSEALGGPVQVPCPVVTPPAAMLPCGSPGTPSTQFKKLCFEAQIFRSLDFVTKVFTSRETVICSLFTPRNVTDLKGRETDRWAAGQVTHGRCRCWGRWDGIPSTRRLSQGLGKVIIQTVHGVQNVLHQVKLLSTYFLKAPHITEEM